MRLLTRDRSFYNVLLAISVPITLQNLITFGVSMMDTVMIGLLGQAPLSAGSLANQFFFVFMIFTFGIAGGANVMIAQYWGRGDTEMIRKTMSIMYRTMLVGAVLFTLAGLFFPRQIMSIFTPDQEVIELGASYMRILAPTCLLTGITNTTLQSFRAVGTVKISVAVNGTALVINTFLNWVLIFGNLGAPRLEIVGAAIATFISRIVECTIVLVYTLRLEKKVKLRLKDLKHVEKSMLSDYFPVALPVLCNEMLWSLSSSVISVIIGRLGTDFVAANSICSVVFQLVSVVTFGVSAAAATITGNTIGTGDYERTRERARTLMVLSVLIGFCSCAVMYFVRPLVISFYNVPEATKLIADQLLTVGSVIVFFQTIASVSLMGILRGGGDGHFVLVVDVVFMWITAIPIGALAAFLWKLPIPIVYAFLKSDEVLKSLTAVIRLKKGTWIRDVTQ